MGLIENRSHTIEMPTANRTAVQITLQQITDGLTSPGFHKSTRRIVKGLTCRWVERVVHPSGGARQVIERSKSDHREGSKRKVGCTTRRGAVERTARAARSSVVMERGTDNRSPGVRGETVRPAAAASQSANICSSRTGADTRGRGKYCPLTQVPAETEDGAAWMASRTKRATASAERKVDSAGISSGSNPKRWQ